MKKLFYIPSPCIGCLWAFLLALFLAGSSVEAGYWWRAVPVFGGGYVTGVIYNQSNGDLYLRTNVGGAYRWNPATGEWIPLLDYIGQAQPNEEYLDYVLSMATDPTNPQRLYAAVGGYLNYTGNGAVLISTNRGAAWSQSNFPFPVGGNDNGSPTGERLQVDPNLPSTLYFASQNNGLWYSQNYGQTWSQMTGLTQNNLNFIRPDPASSSPGTACQRLFVGVHATSSNIWMSSNGGQTWSTIRAEPATYYPFRCALAGNFFYVSYCDSDEASPGSATMGAVWRYNDITGSWARISPPNTSYGIGGLCIDPEHPNILMAGTMDDYSPGNEIYRSVDGGNTWNGVLRNGNIDDSEAPYTAANFTYQNWISDLEINPVNSNEVIFVTGYGVYMTGNITQADAGHKATWTFPDRGLEETVVLGLASPSTGPLLLTAVADVAGFRYDNFNASPPNGDYSPYFPTSSSIDFAELNPNIVARSHTQGYISDGGPHGSFSKDGGSTWTRFTAEPSGALDSGVLAVAADGSSIVWTPAGEGPLYATTTNTGTYYSTNFGATWTASSGLPNNLEPVADRVNPKKFYAYDNVHGVVYASVNGGVTFSVVSSGLPTFPSYEDFGPLLKAVFGREGNLWLAGGAGGLWRSVNSGATFTQVTTVQSALQVGFGMAATNQSYPVVFLVGTIGGVYGFFQSNDQGSTWTRINDDYHQFGAIYCLTGDERMYGRVYVGTGGRGTVYADPLNPTPEPLHIYPSSRYVNLQCLTEPGWDYVLMQSLGLSSNTLWSGIITNPGTGGTLNYTITPSQPQQFFQMRIQLPQ